MDELSLEQLARESAELKHLLEHRGNQQALEEMEQAVIKEWKAAQTVVEREQCWSDMQAQLRWRQKLRSLSQRNLPTD